jgi:hypothetical protein
MNTNKERVMPQNTLLHTFSVYNALVRASDGRVFVWDNTLGFSLATGSEPWPFVDIADLPEILSAVDEFAGDCHG